MAKQTKILAKISNVLDELERLQESNLQSRARATVMHAQELVQQAFDELEELDAYVSLDMVKGESDSNKDKEFVRPHPTQTRIHKAAAIRAQSDNWRLLSTLARNGFKVGEIAVFSKKEERLMEFMIDNFDIVQLLMQGMSSALSAAHHQKKPPATTITLHLPKSASNRDRGRLKAQVERFASLSKTIDAEGFNKNTDGKRFYQPRWRVPVNWDAPMMDFCRGHWLSCYASRVVRKWLETCEIDYECFSNTKVKSPLGHKGVPKKFELDLVGLTSQGNSHRLIIVECKSGKLRPGDAERCVEISNGIAATFEEFGATGNVEVDSFILTPPHWTKSRREAAELIRKHLKGTGVQLTDIHAFRSEINERYVLR